MFKTVLRTVFFVAGVAAFGLLIGYGVLSSVAFIGTSLLENDARTLANQLARETARADPFGENEADPAAVRDTGLARAVDATVFAADGRLLDIVPGGAPAMDLEHAFSDRLLGLRDRVLGTSATATWREPEPPRILPQSMPVITAVGAPIVVDGTVRGAVVARIDQSYGRTLLGPSLRYAGMAATIIVLCLFGTLSVLYFGRSSRSDQARDAADFLAHHDPLTGLPNRLDFHKRLEEAIGRSRGPDMPFAVLALDLDRFKAVNDTWGHMAGDELLRQVAERLRSIVREEDFVARLSGDEFALLIEGDANPRSVKFLAQRIIEDLSKPYSVEGNVAMVSASAGIALYPVNAETGEELFRSADLALYRAKTDGRRSFRFFEHEMEETLNRRSKLEADLRDAMEKDEFVVFYQPQKDLTTGRVSGHEALLRWERPGEGVISPGEFLPVAEETGLIAPLGEWVLRRACQDAASWIKEGTVAVNFSAAQFRFPGIADMIERVLRETGLEPSRLEMEISEGLFLDHTPELMDTLHRIKALGVRIAMDDFGTRYSSLSYLAQFSFDKIKIDRSFVAQLCEDGHVGAIVSSIVGLGRSLSVDITAEGVETEQQVTMLQAAGCSTVQGFLFGAPKRVDDIDLAPPAAMESHSPSSRGTEAPVDEDDSEASAA